MTERVKCQNPAERCSRVAVRSSNGIRLCRRCFQRFWRNGNGRVYRPWEKYRERKERK